MLKLFKNMKIWKKTAFGFGILIAIILTLGILSVRNMTHVRTEAFRLSDEYVPEVRVVNNLERNALWAIYSMRGYAMSDQDDAHYLKEYEKYISEVKKHISEAQELTDEHPGLSNLKENLVPASEMLRKYEQLAEQTIRINEAVAENRKKLDTAAARYMENARNFLKNQYDTLKEEINAGEIGSEFAERLKRIETAENVIDTGNTIRIANFKAQATADPGIMQEGLKNFERLETYLKDLRSKTEQEINIRRIEEINASAREYKAAMDEVLRNQLELQTLNNMRTGTAREFAAIAKETSFASMDRMVGVVSDSVPRLSQVSRVIIVGLAVAVLIAMGVAAFITVTITRPIAKIVEFTKEFGDGDLSSDIAVDSKDEIGDMARSLNTAVAEIKAVMYELSETTDTLFSSSKELSSLSTEMASFAGEMDAQSGNAASASEQVNASMNIVASAAEQASSSVNNIASMTEEMSSGFETVARNGKKTADNVKAMAAASEAIYLKISTVASASEEMTASLNEVAKNTAQASRISQNASQRTGQINETMGVLVSASKKIGKVVGIIKDIADQTNMLALNATIEAAGAGDAGKGFAVVAGEIKELAKQSADATDEIAGQIEEIQTSTADVVRTVAEISAVISEIADINEMIASSVEEQSATAGEISKSVAGTAATVRSVAANATESADLTEEIAKSIDESSKTAVEVARNIDELSTGVREVARSSAEAAQTVNSIAKNIKGISDVSKQTAAGAAQTHESSKELAKMASAIKQIVSRFKLRGEG